jgi:hypothetical protein
MRRIRPLALHLLEATLSRDDRVFERVEEAAPAAAATDTREPWQAWGVAPDGAAEMRPVLVLPLRGPDSVVEVEALQRDQNILGAVGRLRRVPVLLRHVRTPISMGFYRYMEGR